MINKNYVLKIAHVMSMEGFDPNFIKNMINLAFEFVVSYEIMASWYQEEDELERISLIEDMKDMIEDIKNEK